MLIPCSQSLRAPQPQRGEENLKGMGRDKVTQHAGLSEASWERPVTVLFVLRFSVSAEGFQGLGEGPVLIPL